MNQQSWRLIATLALLIAASLMTFGCFNDGSSPEAAERQGFDNFKTAVARTDRNYDIYWMGRDFEAGGLTYEGPDVADFGDEVDGGGLGMHYLARSSDFCCRDLHIVIYSDAAWEKLKLKRSTAPQPRATVRSVTVNGHQAELRTNRGTLYPVSAQILVIDFGQTVIEATTRASTPATPSPVQPNPLIDEATFLAAMENLRPYPD